MPDLNPRNEPDEGRPRSAPADPAHPVDPNPEPSRPERWRPSDDPASPTRVGVPGPSEERRKDPR